MKEPGVLMFVLSIVCLGCGQAGLTPTSTGKHQTDSIIAKVYKVDDGWGYDICKNEKVLVHQPFIPVIEGYKPFTDSTLALSTAKLVIEKIRKNIIPPAVSRSELDSLGVIHGESALTNKP